MTHHNCGGTILTGCNGTAEEHDYCDRCGWRQDRAERETWYTWRTDAASGGLWAPSVDDAVAQLVAEREWAAFNSIGEASYIADGAWLTIFADGVPVLRRGEMQ